MPNYRRALADKLYVDIAVEAGVCLMDGGTETALAGLGIGDRVLFFSPCDKPNGAALNAYTAIATIKGQRLRKTDWDGVKGFKAWVMPCTYADVTPLPADLPQDSPVAALDADAFNAIARQMEGP